MALSLKSHIEEAIIKVTVEIPTETHEATKVDTLMVQ
jgi:hypothetical protein